MQHDSRFLVRLLMTEVWEMSRRTLGVLAGMATIVAVLAVIAARRNFDEYGVYFGCSANTLKLEDPHGFAQEIASASHVVLQCGGDETDPDEAVRILRGRYGRQEMLRRCTVTLFGPEEIPQGTGTRVAYSILYREGDARLLAHLMALRAQWYNHRDPAREERLTRMDRLIAGLAWKLDRSSSPAAPSLTDSDFRELRGY